MEENSELRSKGGWGLLFLKGWSGKVSLSEELKEGRE